MDSQHELVTRQFDGTAAAYAKSSTHNDSAALEDVLRVIDPQPGESALDIASGPGTVALLLAPHVARAVALDLTASMLQEAARRAAEAGYDNFETVQAPAENLPFADEEFDIVAVRTAPHHFANVQAAVNEMARVVKPTGRVVIIDTTAPDSAELDRELNEIELLRDRSHVRNYTPEEWRTFVSNAGLRIEFERVHTHALGKRLLFSDWVSRMRVPEGTVNALRKRFRDLPDELAEILQVRESDGEISFTLPEITIVAKKSGGQAVINTEESN